MYSKKRTFLFFFFFIVVITFTGLIIFMQNYSVKNIDYIKENTLAANSTCTVTGKTTGSFNFSYNAWDQTSGVDYWECHNASTNSWTTCPNSSKCTNYKINANSGYDQIRVVDVSGHVSSIEYLYKKTSIQFTSFSSNSSSVTKTGGSKAKIIDSSYAYTGSINSVNIQSNETIKVTGTAESCSKDVYAPAHRELIKQCSAGTYNPSTGNCEAESYRLQNDTCWCAMQLVNGKIQVAWEGSKGTCSRKSTYCTDEFKSSDNAETRYEKATLDQKYGAVGVVCTGASDWGSSCQFSRPNNSECYTQYNDISQVMSKFSENYDDYADDILEYTNRTNNVKNSLAGFATKSNPCSTASNNYVAATNLDTLCTKIAQKNVSTNYAIKSTLGSNTIYIYPVISSAPCNWIEKKPDEINSNYGKYSQSIDGDYFYYCDGDGEVITANNTCKKEEKQYCYNYTVDYYYGG